jgi:HAD superfamily hydrolase (TIGR01509 family)
MQARWSPFIKQIVVIGSVAALVWLLASIHVLLIPLILALLLAYLISFPVGWIMRHTGWPRSAVVAILYVLVLLILIIAPVLLMPRLMALFNGLSQTLRTIFLEMSETTPKPIELTPTWSIDLGPFYAPINQWLTSIAQPEFGSSPAWPNLLFPFAGRAAIVVRGAVTSVIWTLFILMVSLYVAKDGPMMGRFIFGRIPEQLEPELLHLWREFTAIWDAFVRGQLLLGLTMGLLVWLVMSILGLRNAAALGLLAAIGEFLPGIGPVIAASVGILIALVRGSTWLPLPNLGFAVLVAVAYFSLTQFENLYLLPRIVGRRIALHPVVVIIAALAGAQLAGVIGILLAAPAVASLRVLLSYGVRKLLDEDPFPPQSAEPEQEIYWRGLLRERPVAALLLDLDGTLVENDREQIAHLAARLALLRRILPRFEPDRAARRLLMTGDLLINDFSMLLGPLRLRRPFYQIFDRLRIVQGHAATARYVPVPGSLEMLAGLARSYPLALVTSRNASDAQTYLKQFGLADTFQVVVTRDDLRQLKPHPAPFNLAAKRLGINPTACVLIGDTSLDLRAGRGSGAMVIGVLSGLGSSHDLRLADLVIPSIADLGQYLCSPAPDGLTIWTEATDLAD